MAEKLVQVGNAVVAFPADMSDDDIAKVLNSPAPEPRSTGQEVGRQLGLTARAALEGVAAPATAVLEFGKGAYNLGAAALGSESRAPEFAQQFSKGLTAMGLPEPENRLERAVQSGAQAMAGTAGLAGLAPKVPALAAEMGKQIPVSGVAGLVSQPAFEVVKDYTGSDLAATIAGVGMGSLAAGASGRILNAMEKGKPVYTMQEIKDRASRSYKSLDNSNISVKPQSALNMVQDIRKALDEARMIPNTNEAKAVEATLMQMEQIIGTQRVPFSTIERLRQMANDLKTSNDSQVSRLGKAAVSAVDNYIDKLNAKDLITAKGELDNAVKTLKESRKDWRNASRAEILEDALNVADIKKERPNASESELIRTGFINIAANKNKMSMFSPAEQNVIKSVVRGGSLDSVLSFTAQFSPTRSKLSAAAYAFGASQSPATAALLGGTGFGAEVIQNAMRRAAAKEAANRIASGAVRPTPPNLAYRGLLTGAMNPPQE